MDHADATPSDTDERIDDIDVVSEMRTSYVDYALSVVHARALPDARDGLKPVQRRIIYQMSQMGLLPARGHVKSSRVVGDVMGRLHPHGDTAIYDALVRMASPDIMRVPLVDGHGNFGSLDDGPAAPRYTEARLAAPALLMVADLEEDAVEMEPNYDATLMQPSVLPSAFPNLIVNGASGIAVGMATNMAPHNPREAIAAALHLLAHPDADVDEIMQYLPGPDLPSGGLIVGLKGVRDAYATGRGAFVMRAKAEIGPVSARRNGITITALPYMVGPEQVMEKIKDAVGAKRIQGISAAHDLTDRKNGLKLVIEMKNGVNPEAVLHQLYRYTPLETNFVINSVVLVDGQPKTLGMRELLDVYLNHRIDVVRRRSRFRLAKAKERLHLVEGLLIAVVDIDEVIAVIRSSDDADSARSRLMSVFDLSKLQADHILELRLRRLTKFSQIELEAERDALAATIATLQEILSDDSRLRQVVGEELSSAADALDTPRRTLLLEEEGRPIRAADTEQPPLELPDTACRVLVSTTGFVARTEARPMVDEAAAATPEIGDSLPALRRHPHDAIADEIDATVRSSLGAVTSTGLCVRFPVDGLPAMPAASIRLAGGLRLASFLGVPANAGRIVGVVALTSSPLALGTAHGVVKRVTPDWPDANEFSLITLRDNDEVIGVGPADDEAQLVFISTDARLLHFPASRVRPQGRAATGMAGISLGEGARVLHFRTIRNLRTAVVTTVAGSVAALPGTDSGSAKSTPLADFPPKGRATSGVRAQRFRNGEDALLLAWAGNGRPLAVDAVGKPVDLPETLQRRDASGAPLHAIPASVGASVGA